jgi:cytochrome c peroxidase
MHTLSKAPRLVALATAVYVAALAAAAVGVHAQVVRPTVPLTSLRGVAVPEPPNLAHFVQDRTAAIALGKALFWDMQTGSDSLTACASCHFHAGADNRVKNVMNPNLNNMAGAPTSTTFNPVLSGNAGGPNYTVRKLDFPFHQLSNPNDRESIVMYDTDDVVGSAGVYSTDYKGMLNGVEQDVRTADPIFQVGGIPTRKVEPRNTPTAINAALNFRNFWDGRANFVFNGVNPFGPRDKDARIWIDVWSTDPKSGALVERAEPAAVRIPFASAASQSVGPVLSGFEMSAAGRTFPDVAKKLLATQPLKKQTVASDDSVLGSYATGTTGLNTTYEALIQKAFWPDFYAVPDPVFQTSSGQTKYRQIEMNFSLFWGIAVQLYESTLISDDSPFDRFASGDLSALTAQQQQGLAIFSSDRGRCASCHKGAEFTGASTRMVLGTGLDTFGGDGPIESMMMGDRQLAIYDNGFYNIGVVPAANDVGIGGNDPFGNPLSFTRQLKGMLKGVPAPDALSHSLDPCTFQALEGCTVVNDPNMRDAVTGSFKTPTLRNIELTGPYFHNGGAATLEQVIDFYSRGGNVRKTAGGDTSGFGATTSNVDLDVMPILLTPSEKAALVAFLKALTDDRVRYEAAPFDHPSLRVPQGATGDNVTLTTTTGVAVDQFISIPAVGQTGLSVPIKPFTPAR